MLGGRRIQHSIMGGIMRDIRNLSQTVIVDKGSPQLKICPECGSKNKLTLKDRRYTCGCRYAEAGTAGLTGLARSV
jgi:ribosomal protein S27AE